MRACFPITFGLVFTLFFSKINAQKPIGKFYQDSLSLGESINYSLSISHSQDQEVIFPDEKYNFGTFECVEKNFFATKTKNKISVDSAIYTLRSFDIDSVQKLQLPIFYYKNGVLITVLSNTDSIIFGQKAPTRLIKNETPLPIDPKINYTLFAIQFISTAFVGFLFWLFFGAEIRRQIKAISLIQQHRDFNSGFKRNIKNLDKPGLLKGMNRWKKFIGALHQTDMTTLTSTEIVKMLNINGLENALGTVDNAIFGNTLPQNISDSLEFLQQIAKNEHLKNRAEILKRKAINA